MKRISIIGIVLLIIISLYSCKSIDSLMKEGKYQEAYEMIKTNNDKNYIFNKLYNEKKYKEIFELFNNDMVYRRILIDRAVKDGLADDIKSYVNFKEDGGYFVGQLVNNNVFISFPSSLILSLVHAPQSVYDYNFVCKYVIPALVYYRLYIGNGNMNIAYICLYYNISRSNKDFLDNQEAMNGIKNIIRNSDLQDFTRLCIVTNSGEAYVIDTNKLNDLANGHINSFKYGNYGVQYVRKLNFEYDGFEFNMYLDGQYYYFYSLNKYLNIQTEQILDNAIKVVDKYL